MSEGTALTPENLYEVLCAYCWAADTRHPALPWQPSVPELGHCAVTALIVQDEYGGELRGGRVRGQSHYWNVLGTSEIDLTRGAFTEPWHVDHVRTARRDYLLSAQDTERRYRLLRERLDNALCRTMT